jgi:hypothetical protein
MIQRRVDEYNRNGDPKVFYHKLLAEHLGQNPGKGSFDLIVTTIGEAKTVTSNRYGRTINGSSKVKRRSPAIVTETRLV